MKRNDLTGKRFGMLTVIGLAECNGMSKWTCRCDCGNECVYNTKQLIENVKISCTAVRVPVFVGHSEAVTVEFEKDITPPLGLGMYAGMTLAESDFDKTFKNNVL